tara:strand:- start:3081 stop:3362 length:282 start_codon:yes stop_codon:yes gene_type:complete
MLSTVPPLALNAARCAASSMVASLEALAACSMLFNRLYLISPPSDNIPIHRVIVCKLCRLCLFCAQRLPSQQRRKLSLQVLLIGKRVLCWALG